MEISGDQDQSDAKRADPLFALSQTVRGFVRRMIGIFTLTEEERLKAGIFLGGEGRE